MLPIEVCVQGSASDVFDLENLTPFIDQILKRMQSAGGNRISRELFQTGVSVSLAPAYRVGNSIFFDCAFQVVPGLVASVWLAAFTRHEFAALDFVSASLDNAFAEAALAMFMHCFPYSRFLFLSSGCLARAWFYTWHFLVRKYGPLRLPPVLVGKAQILLANGWAQVNQRHVTSVSDIFVKLHYDFFYIKHFSL